MAPQSVTLPSYIPQTRLHQDAFRGEPATARFDRLFTPNPGSPEGMDLTIGSRLPPAFRQASSCPGLDHLASGCILVTSGAFTPRPTLLSKLRTCRFRFGCLLKQLTSPLRHTPCPVFRNGGYDPVIYPSYYWFAPGSFRIEPFGPYLTVTTWFQALFTLLSQCFSAFSRDTSLLSDFLNI